MAAVAWLSAPFPQTFLLEGFRDPIPRAAIVRSGPDVGGGKVRSRGRIPGIMAGTLPLITTDQVTELETYVYTTLEDGTAVFNFLHPRLGTTLRCRMLDQDGLFFDPIFKGPKWSVALQMEVL